MEFTIDPAFLSSITIHKTWMTEKYEAMTPEERAFSSIKGENHNCASMHTEDHPEFAKLREQLGQDGYISIQRGWWNGDSVIKPFTLNGKKFEKGEQFPSGAAIKYTVENK